MVLFFYHKTTICAIAINERSSSIGLMNCIIVPSSFHHHQQQSHTEHAAFVKNQQFRSLWGILWGTLFPIPRTV
jgi:hypothetical protein